MNSSEIIRLYVVEKVPPRLIGPMYGKSISTIRRLLLANGVQMRSVRESTILTRQIVASKLIGIKRIDAAMREKINAGKRARAARVGIRTRITQSGYVEICSRISPDYGRGEHVVIMERHIGRHIAPNEVVHHKDRNRSNNTLDNLELMTRSAHSAHHIAERLQEKKQ